MHATTVNDLVNRLVERANEIRKYGYANKLDADLFEEAGTTLTAMRQTLRALAIYADYDSTGVWLASKCEVCSNTWTKEDKVENHAPGCLAAL